MAFSSLVKLARLSFLAAEPGELNYLNAISVARLLTIERSNP